MIKMWSFFIYILLNNITENV